MSLTLTENTTGDFAPCPAGTHTARCVQIIDMGTQKSVFEGEEKNAKKIWIAFEITDPSVLRNDGSPFVIGKRYTSSLHQKAAVRALLEGWRGKPFSAAELAGFDLKNVVGLNCLLSVTHTQKGERIFANLGAALKLPTGFTAPTGNEPLTVFELSNPDWQAFARLGSRLQNQIAESPEFAKSNPPASVALTLAATAPPGLQSSASASPAPSAAMPEFAPHDAAGGGFDDMPDDMPF